MEFRTELAIKPSLHTFNYQSKLVSIGSCFANVVGGVLARDKFNIISNPLGIIYNPISLWEFVFAESFSDTYAVERDGVWFNLQFHSEICGSSKAQLMELILERQLILQHKLKQASHLVITLGTAWVYELKATHQVVANCHKQPLDLFNKRLLTLDEIKVSFANFYTDLIGYNPHIKIIFTLSPVRHIKDTLPLNAVSKALLRVSIHELVERYSSLSYFPSYELLLDDLRDYRYYAEDMLHPSPQAEKYIVEKFYDAYLDAAANPILKKVQAIISGLEHRAFHEHTEGHQIFLRDLLAKARALADDVNLAHEIEFLTEKLSRS